MSAPTLLLINSRFLPVIGGGETYVLELMSHFAAQGWNVHLATASPARHEAPYRGKATIHYIDGFTDADQHHALCLPQLRRVLDTVKPDVVHIHNLMPFFAYTSITEEREFPTVLTIHNTPDIPRRVFGTFKDYPSEYIFTRQLLRTGKFDKLLVGSHFYLSAYAAVAPWILNDKAHVVHYFPPQITASHPQNVMTPSKSGDEVRLLFPSRLLKRKGIEDTLQALAQLPDNFKLVLPGYHSPEDEGYRAQVDALIDKLDVRARLIVPDGIITPEKMPHYYDTADMVLVPSHYEGFGIVAVEAMAHAKPLIATASGGLGEIVRDRHNALVVPSGDPEAIATAATSLHGDSRLRRLLTQGGLATINNRFDRTAHMETIESIYDDIR